MVLSLAVQGVLVLALFVQIPDLNIFSVKMSDRFALLGFTEYRNCQERQKNMGILLIVDSSNLPASQGAKCAAQGSEY